MIQLFLDPLVLMALIWGVTRQNMEGAFFRLFHVSLGIGLGSVYVVKLTSPFLGGMSLVPCLCLAVIILMKFCYTTLQQSVVIAVLFGAWKFGFDLLVSSF